MFYFLTLTQGRYRCVVEASLELVPTPSPPESASRDYGKIIACGLDAPFKRAGGDERLQAGAVP